jgi:hypothetical protein
VFDGNASMASARRSTQAEQLRALQEDAAKAALSLRALQEDAAKAALSLGALGARVAQLESVARVRDLLLLALGVLYMTGMLSFLVRAALGLGVVATAIVGAITVVRPTEPAWLLPAARALRDFMLRGGIACVQRVCYAVTSRGTQ